MKKQVLKFCSAMIFMLSGLVGCANIAENVGHENIGTELIFGDSSEGDEIISEEITQENTKSESAEQVTDQTETENPWIYIDPCGVTLGTRINTPEGYTRTEAGDSSLTTFLRTYPMKADGAEVLLYNGSPKGNQRAHVAVFALPIEAENLQQCADSVMRVYAEYCWHNGLADRIAFRFTNGFLAEYGKWRDGYRIAVNGNDISWTASAGYDDSYETFQKYMRMVFAYAGTLSMDTYESAPITLDELQVGDVFLKGGSPGHVVMVVDVCENESGDKAFLLGQGYMPAQEFHVIKNPAHTDDPWYYEEEVTYPFRTAEYTFPEGSLRRLSYLDWTWED